jgi:polyribonucleotide nucleotidyltransferase
MRAAYALRNKQERTHRIRGVESAAIARIAEDAAAAGKTAPDGNTLSNILYDLQSKIVRNRILSGEPRIDGRDTRTVRPISIRTGVLPRSHGSALFTRGETQALVVATLGTARDEQIIDAITGEYRERFMLQYNMPPFATGETGRVGSPKRREIGHGRLAKRALIAVLPKKEDFPYTLRVVSEITESNGSSSMATVCGSSLALMDAGVPLKRPCAGIAMGLIKEDKGFAVLSDILGDEDHLGDMDFKVAGTEVGVTSLQMDIKITSITPDIMKIALEQAREGRLHILGEMAKALTGHRGDVAETAPRITMMNVPKEKIRDVIGTGGKVIREIVEQTKCKIDINDDGTIKIASNDAVLAQQAMDWIRGIVAEPEIGVIYTGKVVKTADFGAFVNFLGARDGLVHISELQQGRVAKTTDVVNQGDTVKVKVIGFDDRGKVKLSMRVVDQATGEDITEQVGAKPPRQEGEREHRGDRDRGDRGDRGDRRPRRDHHDRGPRDRDSAPVAEGSDQPPMAD